MKISYTFRTVIGLFLTSAFLTGCHVREQPAAPENAFSEPTNVSLPKPGKCVTPPSGLVSWWPGDGNAVDIVDNNHGALQNGATFAPGMVGLAFSLDGTDDYVSIPNLDMNVFSFEAWVKRDRIDVPGFDRLLMSVDCGGWGVYFDGDNTVRLTHTCYSNVGSGGIVTDFEWHHIAVTYDGFTAYFYLDGTLDSSSPYGVSFNSQNGGNYSIGSRGASEFFKGLIDEIRVYDRALSGAEIQAIFAAGSAGMCKDDGKVTICHKPGTPAQKTMVIPIQALAAHLGHGDVIGPCP